MIVQACAQTFQNYFEHGGNLGHHSMVHHKNSTISPIIITRSFQQPNTLFLSERDGVYRPGSDELRCNLPL